MTLLGQTDCFSPWHTLWRNRNFKLWINKVLCCGTALLSRIIPLLREFTSISEGPICGWHWVRAQWNRIRATSSKKFHPEHLYKWGSLVKWLPVIPTSCHPLPFCVQSGPTELLNKELMAKVLRSFPRLGHKRMTSVLLMQCSFSLWLSLPHIIMLALMKQATMLERYTWQSDFSQYPLWN